MQRKKYFFRSSFYLSSNVAANIQDCNIVVDEFEF